MTDIVGPRKFEERGADLIGSGWTLVDEGRSISKTFTFSGFAEAMVFMTRVAFDAEAEDHHPDWRNVCNTVHVTLTTHELSALSTRDLRLARRMEDVAAILVAM